MDSFSNSEQRVGSIAEVELNLPADDHSQHFADPAPQLVMLLVAKDRMW